MGRGRKEFVVQSTFGPKLSICILKISPGLIGIKIGEITKVIVTPPQIFVWVPKSPATTKKVPKNSSNRFQIGLKGLVLWTQGSKSVDRGSPGFLNFHYNSGWTNLEFFIYVMVK